MDDQASEPTATAFANTVIGTIDAAPMTERHIVLGHDRFAIAGELGRGGMGIVYEADDQQFGRRVALKSVTRKSASLERRFVTESIVTANLEHPGVAPVYERGFDSEGMPFYTMRLVRGRTLSEEVASRRTIATRLELLPEVIRVAQTLAFAHEHGVVHRDVKPDNVIVGDHGDTVLLDWGIARVRGMPLITDDETGSSQQDETRMGAVIGTPAYMAPEQARGEIDKIDERTDVFALGALLYHVLTGEPPFRTEPGTDPLTKARDADAPPLRSAAPKAPGALRDIVERAMHADAGERFQSAGEVAAALEGFINDKVAGRESPLVRFIASGIALGASIMVLAATFFVMSNMPAFAALGYGAYNWIGFTICGLLLSLIEWRTRGRYALSRLAVVMAAGTFLLGLSASFEGLIVVLRGAMEVNEAADFEKLRYILIAGPYEALGNIAPSCTFTVLQLIAWGLVDRSNQRSGLE